MPPRHPWSAASPGASVEVRSRFDGSWVPGFQIAGAERLDEERWRYRVQRTSDRTVLPEGFADDEVRLAGDPIAPGEAPGTFWPGLG